MVVVNPLKTFLVSVSHPKRRAASDLMTIFSAVQLIINRKLEGRYRNELFA